MAIPYISNNAMVMPSLSTVGRGDDLLPVVGKQADKTATFADFLSDAISDTVSTDYESKVTDVGMVLGETQDLHTVTIAGQKAEIMLSLTVQMRDRIVEAYQEIMRMQI